ncbi:hypothetical protein J1605_015612 [Eschrichtius robustus]|uniref:Uncharacterized protein n=1 Tax=Eschrichtius robustus TaxID=9764 RepID=A0AB34GDC4_ESCRO|nr:hypothetical protein J1605_015612 [Eschrichtius robustus]
MCVNTGTVLGPEPAEGLLDAGQSGPNRRRKHGSQHVFSLKPSYLFFETLRAQASHDCTRAAAVYPSLTPPPRSLVGSESRDAHPRGVESLGVPGAGGTATRLLNSCSSFRFQIVSLLQAYFSTTHLSFLPPVTVTFVHELGGRTMLGVTVKDVNQREFVRALAVFLKKSRNLKVPEWVDTVKTAKHKELTPYGGHAKEGHPDQERPSSNVHRRPAKAWGSQGLPNSDARNSQASSL